MGTGEHNGGARQASIALGRIDRCRELAKQRHPRDARNPTTDSETNPNRG
jgi:hypothetical protein